MPALFVLFALLSVITLSSIAPNLASKQLLFFIISGLLFVAASYYPFSQYLRLSRGSYIFACLFLLIPVVFSLSTRNTARWIPVGDWFNIQPSQFTLPLVSLALLQLIAKTKAFGWHFLIRFFALVALPIGLILIEPDLDTTIVLSLTMVSLLFFLPIAWKFLVGFGISGICLVFFAWFFVLQPYQKLRITSFFTPAEDIQGSNYNARQALIAVGSGQVIGRGLGQGVQSHLRFLPERQTDFLFASLAEEYGLMGSSLVLLLYALLVAFLIWASRYIKDLSGKLYLVMLAVLFFLQAMVNINMNIGLLPISGITLPLLSYGGSSLLGLSLALGIAQSLIKQSQKRSLLHIA